MAARPPITEARYALPGLSIARHAAGLSLATLAERIGWKRSQAKLLWRIEHGKRTASWGEAKRLARACKVRIEELQR